jgi:hypothetical protein
LGSSLIYTVQIKQELEKVRLCRHQIVIVVGGLRSKVIRIRHPFLILVDKLTKSVYNNIRC